MINFIIIIKTMKYNKYKIEDIQIGGEVYFDNVYSGKLLTQSNFDMFWKVHDKNDKMLLISLWDEHHWSIDVAQVKYYNDPNT
jgi:hypothetical protein